MSEAEECILKYIIQITFRLLLVCISIMLELTCTSTLGEPMLCGEFTSITLWSMLLMYCTYPVLYLVV